MKVALNLSTSPRPRERYALAWAVPVALVALAGLLLFSLSSLRDLREYGKLHRSLLELQDRENRARDRELILRGELERPQSREVFGEAHFVNTLINERQFSLTELTAKVTELLPAAVRLTGLALSQPGSEPVVRFTVTGNEEEAVETFLSNLEDSSDFAGVTIINQGFGQESSPVGAVILTCTAHYVGGTQR